MVKENRVLNSVLVPLLLGLSGALISCSPLANSKRSTEAADRSAERSGGSDSADCQYSFKELGICASLQRANSDPIEYPAEVPYLLRFWNPSQSSSSGPYLDPGLDVWLLPRRCPRCQAEFKAELWKSTDPLANDSSGPVFYISPRIERSGEHNMGIKLERSGGRIGQAWVKMNL